MKEQQEENKDFLTTQIITYLGNKRSLIYKIEDEVKSIRKNLNKEKLICADLFSGSGIVARMLKKYSSKIIVNDLENYSYVINGCYLTNKEEYPKKLCNELRNEIISSCLKEKIPGIITKNYAPKDDNKIQRGERVFYTHKNALLIDTYRNFIDKIISEENLKRFFLAPLITEASIHVNTSGVFKGFYKNKNTGIGCFGASGKNALTRILGEVELKEPVFSNFNSELEIFTKDAVLLSKEIKNVDMVYIDPPYNQHPYGSNYFMLNLILKNRLDVPISPVSGITQGWKRSVFNKRHSALKSLEEIISSLDSKYAIISYNSEGFISFEEMSSMLQKYGELKTSKIKYNTFRGSRNLNNRSIHVSEYLFVLKK
ncbi:DNA adenine methylase [Treponema putidum]|uniref:site-specific DNA-methyltransferase (adenine-specific) n=1 Tax=Treponema putidum TaxID=221027 RepID=A0ABY5HQD6_9SPIR|nr:DNA adenine methylase [Treponema putidum]AIN93733.1 DNA modification methylase [Treponema putidum]TWI77836.1 adenine-specific DNA-methyltransferase [Treponema putidum]UTY27672.1 DNA modification methylase [Treponema putidum]UTY30139.1 DNA modification methylase [Treponema putidum]